MIRASASIEKRLARHWFMALLMLMVMLAVLVELGVAGVARQFVTTRLQHDAESVLTGLSRQPDGQWLLDDSVLPPVYRRPFSGHYYAVQVAGQTLYSRSLWDQRPALASLMPGQSAIRRLPGPHGQHWQVWQEGASVSGEDVTLFLAEDVAPVAEWVSRFRWQMASVVVAMLALFLLIQRQLLRRSFAQLQPLRNAIQAHRQGQAAAFPDTVPAEVLPLANAIERLMDRYRAQLGRSRQTLGNLAHELKRPLQQLRWLAGQQTDEAVRAQLTDLYQQLNHQLEKELRRARIAGDPQPLSPFFPARELPALEKLLSRIHLSRCQLNCHWGDAKAAIDDEQRLPFDRDDMLELVGNLLDNAWRHCRSRVDIRFVPPASAAGEDGDWIIVVEDDGPGIPAAERENLLRRGARLDESGHASATPPTNDGAGLGLSICQAVVQSYHGTLLMDESPLGGLRIEIRLPALPG